MASGTDGNIISYDASGNPVAIATGSDGQILTSTGAGSPPAFEAAPGGGQIGQVVSTCKTDTYAVSMNDVFVDVTGFSVSITPSATSSKIYINIDAMGGGVHDVNIASFKLLRGTTAIAHGDAASSRNVGFAQAIWRSGTTMGHFGGSFLDSPSSTSSLTYKVQVHSNNTVYLNRTVGDADNSSNTRTISTITVMEVLA
jgi:hypothetical protein